MCLNVKRVTGKVIYMKQVKESQATNVGAVGRQDLCLDYVNVFRMSF